MVCGVNETKMDTIVSIEDGVKHKGDRMEVELQNTLYFLLVNAAKLKMI